MSFWRSFLRFFHLDLASRARRAAWRLRYYVIDDSEPFPIYEVALVNKLEMPEDWSEQDYEARWHTAKRVGAVLLGVKTVRNDPDAIELADGKDRLYVNHALEIFAEELLLPIEEMELANHMIRTGTTVAKMEQHRERLGVPIKKFWSSMHRVLHKKR